MEINWDDFEKIDMRVGTIVEVADFPEARRPAFKLLIDFGEALGKKRSSAQLTKRYTKESLLGKQIVAVVNFPKKQIGKFMSECLVMGAVGEDGDVTLVEPGIEVVNGQRIG